MPWTQDQMAARAAQELEDGFYVNLGIGIPTLVANFVPADKEVWLQSENGMLGIGPFPTDDEVVLMEHVARKKDGTEDLKIIPACTLPLTGVGVVNRIITDLAVMDVTPQGLKLVELAPEVTREFVQSKTGVTLV